MLNIPFPKTIFKTSFYEGNGLGTDGKQELIYEAGNP